VNGCELALASESRAVALGTENKI